MITVQKNINLKPYNTFGLSSIAKEFVIIDSKEALKQLIKSEALTNQPFFILGGGSNILLTGDFDGLVVKIEIKGIHIVSKTDDHVWIQVGAGEVWNDLVQYCIANDWGGVENLSLIPGTVGAAPMQNIGAYGVEIKDVIESVEAVDIHTGDNVTFSNESCKFGYRESIFKHEAKDKYIISSVTLRLTTRHHKTNIEYGAIHQALETLNLTADSLSSISKAVIHIRESKLPDPKKIGNAGSFFKNPTISNQHYLKLKEQNPDIPGFKVDDDHTKVPAAWLIEQCGWKGKRFDSIGVHTHQALVLVNYGGGHGDELWNLAVNISKSVEEKFNITLHPEVNKLSSNK
jgi:UDP-N-acetylmuramate dehydrogenase